MFAPPLPPPLPCAAPPPPSALTEALVAAERPAGCPALTFSVLLRLLCATAAVSAPTCAWPPPQTRRTPPHWPSQSCWAASSAAGAAARTRYPGEGPGGRADGYPGELTELHGGCVASPPSHPNSFGERSPGRAPLEQPPDRPRCSAGASLAGPHLSSEGAACDRWGDGFHRESLSKKC